MRSDKRGAYVGPDEDGFCWRKNDTNPVSERKEE